MEQELLERLIIKATRDVFGMMLGMEITPGRFYEEQRATTETETVVALIGLAGACIGTGMISCPPALACKISSRMLMTHFEAVSEDILDAMGEMANMIFGGVKTELEEHFGQVGLSIPTVIFGRNFETRTVAQKPWTVVPVKAGSDLLELKICLIENRGRSANFTPNQRTYALLLDGSLS